MKPWFVVCQRRGALLVLALVVWFARHPAPAGAAPQPADLYERSLSLKESGDWEKALQGWLEARDILDREGRSDPRIGFAFIELATERGATTYYPAASELYFWGLRRADLGRFEEVIREELDRMAPILARQQRNEWRKLLSAHDPALNAKIIRFWARQDPAPSTPQNERLLEHWLRIAHSRKNFRKGKSTVYGTDDRGLVYVKYGEPERIGSGRLGTNRFVFRRWTDILAQYHGASRADVERVIRELDRHNNTPEYEVWVYTTFDPKRPIFFLFGRENGSGSFGLRRGVEELIADRAFLRTSTRYTGGLLPGAVLQAVYYGELIHYHDYFVERLRQLEDAWFGFERSGTRGLSSSSFRTLREHFQLLDKERVERTNEFAPSERSTFDRTVAPVDMTLQSVRLLDENDLPIIAFVALTSPQLDEAGVRWTSSRGGPGYRLVHTLVLRDENRQALQRLVDRLPASYANTSTFLFPHTNDQTQLEFIAEVFERDAPRPASADPARPSPVPALIGLGRVTIDSDSLLDATRDRLELSDLVIGVKAPEPTQRSRLPFPVVPGNTILHPDHLKVYLEVYHLALDSTGVAHYAMDLKVTRLKGRKKTRKEMISLRFDLDAPTTRSTETFDIDISTLPLGEYELAVEVTDTVSDQRKSRSAVFQIVEEKPTQ